MFTISSSSTLNILQYLLSLFVIRSTQYSGRYTLAPAIYLEGGFICWPRIIRPIMASHVRQAYWKFCVIVISLGFVNLLHVFTSYTPSDLLLNVDFNVFNNITRTTMATPKDDPCLFTDLDRNITTLLSPNLTININPECIKYKTFFHAKVVNPPSSSSVYQNSHICQRMGDDDQDVYLLIIVLSATTERFRRDAIRRTWGNDTFVAEQRVAKVFLLGKSTNDTVEQDVADENHQYRDICKEDFIDSYQNLTLKTLMGLRWAYAFCPSAKFVLKIDTDTIPNLQRLMKDLQNITSKTNLVQGHLQSNAHPVRNTGPDIPKYTAAQRWVMTIQEYRWSRYPSYVEGPSYLLSSDLLPRILVISRHVKHIKLEDVFIGMILNILGVTPQQNHRFTQIPTCTKPGIPIKNACRAYWAYTFHCYPEVFITINRKWLNSKFYEIYCSTKITINMTLPYIKP